MKKIVLAMGFWLSQAAFAQALLPGCDLIRTNATHTPGSDAIQLLLKAEKYDDLEALLTKRLLAYQQGNESDLLLERDLSHALDLGIEFEEKISKWVQASPKSFMANLVLGIYQVKRGFKERGTGFIDQTSQGKIEAMKKLHDSALPYLTSAMELNPNSALPHTYLLNISATQAGMHKSALFNQAIKADPKNMAFRASAFNFFSPRWGGSFEALKYLVQEGRKANLSPGQVRYLEYSEAMEHGSHYWSVDKKPAEAASFYKQALAMCPNSQRALDGVLNNAKQMEDWMSMVEAVALAETSGEPSKSAFKWRGFANEKLKLFDKAVNDYERSAKMGDPWATGRLGNFFLRGEHIQKDLNRARALLTTASMLGDKNAQKNLEWLDRQKQN